MQCDVDGQDDPFQSSWQSPALSLPDELFYGRKKALSLYIYIYERARRGS